MYSDVLKFVFMSRFTIITKQYCSAYKVFHYIFCLLGMNGGEST